MWNFSDNPTADDFRELAGRLRSAPEHALHLDLRQRRGKFVERLYQMADDAQNDRNQSVYQAVRLLVW